MPPYSAAAPSGGAASSGRSSRRGRDASYLLNFQPLPLPAVAPTELPPPPRRAKPAVSVRQRVLDRSAFLKSQFHLLCRPGLDYRPHTLDPNLPVDWPSVRAVRFVTPELIRCPICLLEPPLAPHIYQCAHVLCLPCALRLHASGADSGADSSSVVSPSSLSESSSSTEETRHNITQT